jgi:predicted glycosyltransferase involved in capsule biosynthesis
MRLTTITPVWKRPDQIKPWLKAIQGASLPLLVKHLVYFVGEAPPSWWTADVGDYPILTVVRSEPPGKSIGFYHNLGAQDANTEWIMKLDIDAVPNTCFFQELLPILKKAQPRQWFNAGMFYISEASTKVNLGGEYPLTSLTYDRMIRSIQTHAFRGMGRMPEATNFICRRKDYLELGGCDPQFTQWGWEDYQQIYMLQKYQKGSDPLPGPISKENVTQRCRDEISRPKARELWSANKWLTLFHRHHPSNNSVEYKSRSDHNRQVLLDYILAKRDL